MPITALVPALIPARRVAAVIIAGVIADLIALRIDVIAIAVAIVRVIAARGRDDHARNRGERQSDLSDMRKSHIERIARSAASIKRRNVPFWFGGGPEKAGTSAGVHACDRAAQNGRGQRPNHAAGGIVWVAWRISK